MNNIKKTGLGLATAAAATVLVAGFAIPANASTVHSAPDQRTSSSQTETNLTQSQYNALRDITGSSTSNVSPVYIAPSVNLGDVASGNAVGSGNDTALLSGNEYSVPVLSGNENAILNNSGNGNSLGDGSKLGSSNSTANGTKVGNGTAVGNGDSSNVSGNGVTGNTVKSGVSNLVKNVTNTRTNDSNNTTTNKTSSSNSSSTSSNSTSTNATSIVNDVTKSLGMGGSW